MPRYTMTLVLRGAEGQKSNLETVAKKLNAKGARVISINSKAGNAVDRTPFNVVTIIYEAPVQIRYP